jgi:hypothetical protein
MLIPDMTLPALREIQTLGNPEVTAALDRAGVRVE